MPRSDEAEAFITCVYLAVQEIPHGRVTSYGHIARLIGKPQCPRQVGQALKHLPLASTAGTNDFHGGNVPWQRVVSADGTIPKRDNPGAVGRHAAALQGEGVEVHTRANGGMHVDLSDSAVGWFPRYLPSEEAHMEALEREQDGIE